MVKNSGLKLLFFNTRIRSDIERLHDFYTGDWWVKNEDFLSQTFFYSDSSSDDDTVYSEDNLFISECYCDSDDSDKSACFCNSPFS